MTPRLTGLFVLLAAPGAAGLLTILGPDHRAPPPHAANITRYECPDHATRIPRKNGRDTAGSSGYVTTVPLAGPITNIPEFHDCQRMLLPGTGGATLQAPQFGPLIAIFAGFKLDSITTWLDSMADQKPASPRGVVNPSVAVAQIFNFGSQAYNPLGIGPGWSCLRISGTPGKLVAWLVPLFDENGCPLVVEGRVAGGTRMEVREIRHNGFSPNDIPPVARWDWDPRHEEQYIGIKCGPITWCEISRRPGQVSSTVTSNAALPLAERRTLEVKGWFDEQDLDVPAAAGPLEPSGVIGTAYPHPDLGSYDETAFASTWRPVAVIRLSAMQSVYDSKFGLKASNDPKRQNVVSLCNGDRTSCGVPVTAPDCGYASLWWAKIDPPGATSRYRCVSRHDHSAAALANGFRVPAAARWHWIATDATLWTRCAEGCCQVN